MPALAHSSAVSGDKSAFPSLVVLRRRLAPGLVSWLEHLPPSHLPTAHILAPSSAIGPALLAQPGLHASPAAPQRALLVSDIAALAKLFASVSGDDWVDLRLEAIRTNACWKFHRDYTPLRLLTTYRGPATQWVKPEHAEAALREQKNYRGPIEMLPAHAAALFRNRPEAGEGIVHRSPPVRDSGITRLFLCLNRRGAWSPEPWAAR